MLKTRTIAISEADWAEWHFNIDRIVPQNANNNRRRALLHDVCRLALDWNDTEVSEIMRKHLRPLFFSGKEIIVPLRNGQVRKR
jgi:hypothetical protein